MSTRDAKGKGARGRGRERESKTSQNALKWEVGVGRAPGHLLESDLQGPQQVTVGDTVVLGVTSLLS